MANDSTQRAVWRMRSSFISSVISTTFVLYALGLLGLLLINVDRLSTYVKENLSFSVVLREDVRNADAEFLRKTLDASPYVKESEFISKERAAEELKAALGEDFLALLKYNPLPPSIELKLHAEWTNNDSLQAISAALINAPQVTEVHYEPDLVDLVNTNVHKLSGLILAFSLVMSFIALVLINNTIRISIYARRFIIKTMQLVGATAAFIQRPFLLRAVRHGFYSALLAVALLLLSIWLVQDDFYALVNLRQYGVLALVSIFVLLVGVAINLATTYFAVGKYLRLAEGDLYY